MPVFTGRMGAPGGEVQAFTEDFDSEEALRREIAHRGCFLLEVERIEIPLGERIAQILQPAFGTKQLLFFTRSLRNLLRAGMPLLDGLQLLAEQESVSRRKSILAALGNDLCRGLSLSEAMSRFPEAFPADYCKTIMAGESSGRLDEALDRLLEGLKRRKEIADKLLTAILYPAFLLLLCAVAVIWLVVDVFPDFQKFFEQTGVGLPWITRSLIDGSRWLGDHLILILSVVLLVAYELYDHLQTAAGRRRLDRFLYEFPLVGAINRGADVARLAGMLATLLRSGIPLVEALRVAGATIENGVARERLDDAIRYIRHGNSVAQSFEATELFPVSAARILRIGEESASLDGILEDLAAFYEEETGRRIDVLVGILPIAAVLAMGGIVLLVLLSVFLPIWEGVSKV